MKVYCDASSLVSLSTTCLLNVIRMFPKAEFIIPESVYRETITSEDQLKRFKWNGLRIKELVEDGIIQVAKETTESQDFRNTANSLFTHKNKKIKIIQKGESDCVGALIKEKQGTLLVDERNTRMLIEDPQQLQKYIENRTAEKIETNQENLDKIRRMTGWIPIIRSTELVAIAYAQGYLKTEEHLEAALLSLKYAGCSITFEEISEYKRTL